jgi:kynurenine 3-monooxygenase
MNFQQEYIPHEYVELKMPAGRHEDGTPAFLLDPNHLHIWPRHSFMLIALPNKVGIDILREREKKTGAPISD